MKTPINNNMKRKPLMLKKITNNILVILLITSGVSMSVFSVGEYYFGSYIESPYHNSIGNESTFVYYGTIQSYINRTEGTTCCYAIGLNISQINNNQRTMSMTIYLIKDFETFNVYKYHNFPFRAGVIKKVGTKTVSRDSQLYKGVNATIFPSSNTVKTKFWNATINSTSLLCMNNVYSLGIPYVYNIHSSKSMIGSYIKYSNFYVLKGIYLSTNIGKEFLNYFNLPALTNDTNSCFNLALAHSNTVPPQNWKGWFTEGIGNAFPVNVALITVGIVVFILRYRR